MPITEKRRTTSVKPAKRKSEGDKSKTREAILDAAEAIMRKEGYAAVTSRRVGEAAGLKSKLVHYYFGTMDELFAALYERSEKDVLEQHLKSLMAPDALRSLWEATLEQSRTSLGDEFIALSNHRKSIRKLIVRTAEQMHTLNTACISRYVKDRGLDPKEFPPAVIAYLLSALAHSLSREGMLGIAGPHEDVVSFAHQWLDRLESTPPRSGS